VVSTIGIGGVPKDLSRALHWYGRAAAKRHDPARMAMLTLKEELSHSIAIAEAAEEELRIKKQMKKKSATSSSSNQSPTPASASINPNPNADMSYFVREDDVAVPPL
jgi:TPR repeat protein